MNDYKTCLKCKKIRSIDEFSNDRHRKDKKCAYCKHCQKIKMDAWTKKNKEHTLKKSRDWYYSHKDHLKEYWEKNRNKRKNYMKEWRKKHKNRLKQYKKDYHIKVELKDPEFRILKNLRGRLRQAIKKNNKYGSTLDLVGCNKKDLKIYIESKFQKGMNWENYGREGWHIDHIIPCSAFDMSKEENQKKCFHYTNLQPLWAIDNCRKNKFIISQENNYKDLS